MALSPLLFIYVSGFKKYTLGGALSITFTGLPSFAQRILLSQNNDESSSREKLKNSPLNFCCHEKRDENGSESKNCHATLCLVFEYSLP